MPGDVRAARFAKADTSVLRHHVLLLSQGYVPFAQNELLEDALDSCET